MFGFGKDIETDIKDIIINYVKSNNLTLNNIEEDKIRKLLASNGYKLELFEKNRFDNEEDFITTIFLDVKYNDDYIKTAISDEDLRNF